MWCQSVRAFDELVENKDEVINLVKNAVKIAVVGDDTEMTFAENNTNENYVKLGEIADSIKFYKDKLTEADESEKTSQALSGELDDIYRALDSLDVSLAEYDDVYVRRLCKEITALSDGKISVEFKFGVKSIQILL